MHQLLTLKFVQEKAAEATKQKEDELFIVQSHGKRYACQKNVRTKIATVEKTI
jgi:hypothetical protein